MSAAVFQPRRAGPTRRSLRAPGMRRSPASRHVAAAARAAALHVRLRGSAPLPRTREPGRDCRLPRECLRRDAGAPETIARVRVPMPAEPMARTGTSLQKDTHPTDASEAGRGVPQIGGTCALTGMNATRGTFRNALPGRVSTRGSPVIKTARASYRPPDRAGMPHALQHAHAHARTHTAVPRPRREFQRRPGGAAFAAAPLPRAMQSICSEPRPGVHDARTRRSPRPGIGPHSVSGQVARHLRAARAVPHAPHTKNPARGPGSVIRPLSPALRGAGWWAVQGSNL